MSADTGDTEQLAEEIHLLLIRHGSVLCIGINVVFRTFKSFI